MMIETLLYITSYLVCFIAGFYCGSNLDNWLFGEKDKKSEK